MQGVPGLRRGAYTKVRDLTRTRSATQQMALRYPLVGRFRKSSNSFPGARGRRLTAILLSDRPGLRRRARVF